MSIELTKSLIRSPSKVKIIKKLAEIRVSTMTELSKELRLNKSTILRHVVTLEKTNLIQRKVAPTDHRMFFLSLTKKGEEVLQFL